MTDTEPLPACDLDAERTLLATAMLNPAALDLVPGEDYYLPAHEAIHAALRRLYAAGANTTVPDLYRELGADAEKVDARVKLISLADPALSAPNADYYADIVREKAAQRRLVEVLTRNRQRAVVNGVPVADLRATLDAELVELDRDRSPAAGFGAVLLGDLLAEPDLAVQYRVDRLLPVGGRVLFSAQFKAGKTTADHNLVRSLVDGEPFLGEFDVAIPAGRVTVLDTELDREMLKRWLRSQNIRKADQVALFSLRGRVSTFNITNPAVRQQWAAQLRALDTAVLVLDCLRPVLDAIGLSEDKDAGQFLVAFDELLVDAGIAEAIVIHHMGHSGERSRGSSRLRDWPDAEWKLVREHTDEDNPAAPRYFSAYGRDVDIAESALAYDPYTRHLSLAGTGGRRQAAARHVIPALLALLDDNPDGLTGRQIEAALTEAGEHRNEIRAALELAKADGRIDVTKGPKRANIHRISVRRRTHLQTSLVDDQCADPDWRTQPTRSPAETD